jgi:hypothetical protein
MQAKPKQKDKPQALPAELHERSSETVPTAQLQAQSQSNASATVGLKVVRSEDGLRVNLDHPDQRAGRRSSWLRRA